MRLVVWLAASLLLTMVEATHAETRARETRRSAPRPRPSVVETQIHTGPGSIDVNRPRSSFDCELPMGEQWYGSRARCLAYLCAGQNVYNEYVFDADNRRRKNPCYGQNPTELPPE